MRGSLPIGEFERIVQDATFERHGGARMFLCAGGAADAPSDTATLVFGHWDNGDWYNISRPNVPEHSEYSIGEDRGKTYRKLERVGWRNLLMDMIADGYIRVTPKIQSMLEPSEIDRAMQRGGRRFTA